MDLNEKKTQALKSAQQPLVTEDGDESGVGLPGQEAMTAEEVRRESKLLKKLLLPKVGQMSNFHLLTILVGNSDR